MPTMKTGTRIGKNDVHGNEICVGDSLHNILTEKTYIVNKYGQLQDENGNKPATFRGEDYEIKPVEEVTKDKPKEEEPAQMSIEEALELVDEKYLVEALRRRGFPVKATKTITIEL